MALASDKQGIASAKTCNGSLYSGITRGNFIGVRTAFFYLRPNSSRVFTARIIIGNDYLICQPGGDGAHLFAFTVIAVTAAAKHNFQIVRCLRPQGDKGSFKRIWRVGKINNNAGALWMAMHGCIRPRTGVRAGSAPKESCNGIPEA